MVLDREHDKAALVIVQRALPKGDFFGMAGSGHEIHWTATAFFEFSASNKISSVWILGDLDALKSQLGVTNESSAFENSLSKGVFLAKEAGDAASDAIFMTS